MAGGPAASARVPSGRGSRCGCLGGGCRVVPGSLTGRVSGVLGVCCQRRWGAIECGAEVASHVRLVEVTKLGSDLGEIGGGRIEEAVSSLLAAEPL